LTEIFKKKKGVNQVEGRRVLRYSSAFQQKVVSEIEAGDLSIHSVRKKYGIRGAATVSGWIRKLGKNHLLGKVVRIEMSDERNRIKELEKEKQKLESALAQAQLKIMALETTIEFAEESYGVSLKKKSGDAK
jgi:transposase-like protein